MATSKPSQEFIPIKEIRDGVVVLKDGKMCMILMVSSLNFSLKSPDEQQGIIMQFQNFLNSLDFSVQIAIQSRRLDIKPYLATLENSHRDQTNELLRIQIREYIGFIRTFTETHNIMTKTFFVVVPFSPAVNIGQKTGLVEKIFGSKNNLSAKEQEKLDFEESRTQLEERANVVMGGLTRTGVRAVVLDTETLIELFFKIFNPGEIIKPASQ